MFSALESPRNNIASNIVTCNFLSYRSYFMHHAMMSKTPSYYLWSPWVWHTFLQNQVSPAFLPWYQLTPIAPRAIHYFHYRLCRSVGQAKVAPITQQSNICGDNESDSCSSYHRNKQAAVSSSNNINYNNNIASHRWGPRGSCIQIPSPAQQ